MITYKPIILVLVLLSLSFVSCKKSNFNRKVKGTYTGVWEMHNVQNGVSYDTTISEAVYVNMYGGGTDGHNNNEDFFLASLYIDKAVRFAYDRKTEEYNYSYTHHYYSSTLKAVFKPKNDSLIVYFERGLNTSTSTGIFRGKK